MSFLIVSGNMAALHFKRYESVSGRWRRFRVEIAFICGFFACQPVQIIGQGAVMLRRDAHLIGVGAPEIQHVGRKHGYAPEGTTHQKPMMGV